MSCRPLLLQQFCLSKVQACGKQKSTKVSGCLTPSHTTKLHTDPHSPRKKSWPVDWPPGEMSVTQSPLLSKPTQCRKWSGGAAQCHHSALLPPCGWIREQLSPVLSLSHAKRSICVSISWSWGGFQSLAHQSKNSHTLLLMAHCERIIDHRQIGL